MQGRKTLPHFFLGVDGALAFGLAEAAATGLGATSTVGVALLETPGFVPDLAGDLGSAGPGVTVGGLPLEADDAGVGALARAGTRAGV